jgi:heme exporter protein D
MWDGVGDFIAMGGHGPYVWGSYGLFAALLIAEMLLLRRRRRRTRAMLVRRLRRTAPAQSPGEMT